MHSLFRVFRWLPGARKGMPGHALYVPVERQGRGRVDNPALYAVLYASDSAAGAIAEALGHYAVWSEALFAPSANQPAARLALATITFQDAEHLDLDDGSTLAEYGVKPSAVVTRERRVTQRWARVAFEERRWAGVSWWSYYDSRWTTFGLWSRDDVRLARTPEPLTLASPSVREAASILNRPFPVD